ncbi:MAG: hypothetical protein QCI00_09175 [Candidatus Thermoplasmatota archaeon]|nr:hypothetical protein [Candidatus Thermoplasmatota archaeon]
MCKQGKNAEFDANGKHEENQRTVYPLEKYWKEIPDLYGISIIVKEFDGFKDVHMTIFRYSGEPPFNPKDYVFDTISKNSEEYDYSKMHIEEHFTLDEVERITEYLKQYKDTIVQKPDICRLPEDGSVMPTGGIPIGGAQDFYVFSEAKDYPLGDLKIAGYYDLRRHEKINSSKPAKYMKVCKKGEKLLVINPDYDWLEQQEKNKKNKEGI